MEPEHEKLTPLKDKGMCSHGNFKDGCIACEENANNQEKNKEAVINGEKKDLNTFEIETVRLENILGTAKSLQNILQDRDKNRLNPLIEENELSRLSSAIRDGEELRNRKTATQDELETILKKITRAIYGIGNTPQERSMREDPENLQAVLFQIGRMRDDMRELGASIAKNKIEPNSALSVIKQLEDELDDKHLFVRRKLSRLNEYFGR